ncbi:ABC transporter ATP-binding protein [Luteimonas aestuarii]|uniref:ABC transporter ATP-binding protein n=2 Tax=Luteimonas aestuarii TaxID=453837 RepID=A0A4R5TYQ9_9GAMM|nr:ABC transporter ATP-binding protein [Luteimonas aestuarii]
MLQLDAIRVGYPTVDGFHVVVDDLSLALPAGGIGCLLGASGCGKTTALRAIAGFEPVQAGSIRLDGGMLSSAGRTLPPEQRGVGMMFQDYALFPHLDVAANIAFGLRGMDKAARRARVDEMLALVGLEGEARVFPHELSGGQQQRIALARALAPAPKLLLLDEPFSNLDVDTRERLAIELRGILKVAGITALLVTHDQAEAFVVADAIGVMDRGRILQWAGPATLYARPVDRFVAGFIGRGSVVPVTALGLPGDGDVLVRPQALVADAAGGLVAEVVTCSFRGPGQVAQLRLASGDMVEIDLPPELMPAPGSALALKLVDDALVLFPPRGKAR